MLVLYVHVCLDFMDLPPFTNFINLDKLILLWLDERWSHTGHIVLLKSSQFENRSQAQTGYYSD